MDEETKSYILDTTVKVKTTKPLRQFISSSDKLKGLKKKLSQKDGLRQLPLEDLKEVAAAIHDGQRTDLLRGDDLDAALAKMIENGERFTEKSSGPYLHELLEGADVLLPENSQIVRSPELTARLEKLRHEQSERDYVQMTKGVSSGKFIKEDTIAFQMKMMNRQLIAVGQVIISVSAGFAFGFFGMPLMIGGIEFGVRLLMGLLAAGVIAVAELYFLAKHLNFDDDIMDGKLDLQGNTKATRLKQD